MCSRQSKLWGPLACRPGASQPWGSGSAKVQRALGEGTPPHGLGALFRSQSQGADSQTQSQSQQEFPSLPGSLAGTRAEKRKVLKQAVVSEMKRVDTVIALSARDLQELEQIGWFEVPVPSEGNTLGELGNSNLVPGAPLGLGLGFRGTGHPCEGRVCGCRARGRLECEK